MDQTNLFGEIIPDAPAASAPEKKKRKPTVVQGYAAIPGTGPEGETCGSCKHRVRIQYSKSFYKCRLMRPRWTHGPGTDIRLKSPACLAWEAGEGEELDAPK